MGVFHPDLVGIQVRVLQELGAQRALVVWGRDGMDELSLGAATLVGELRDGVVREYEVHPEDFGIAMAASRNLRVADAAESKAMLLDALDNKAGPAAGDRRTERRRGAVCGGCRRFDRRRHRARARRDGVGRRTGEAGSVRRDDAGVVAIGFLLRADGAGAQRRALSTGIP